MAVVIRLTECRIVKSMEVQGNQTIILAVLWGWLLLPSQTIRFSFFQINIIFTVIFLNQKNIKDFYATSVFSLPHVWVLSLEQQRVFPSKLLHIKLNSWELITEYDLALLKAVPPTTCFQYSSFGKSLCFLPLPGSLYAKAWRPVIHWLFWIRRFREIPWIWKGFEWLRAACICSLNFTWKHWSLSGEGEPGCCSLKANDQTTLWTSSSKVLGKPCVLSAENIDLTSFFQAEGAGFLVTIPERQCYGNNGISPVSKFALSPWQCHCNTSNFSFQVSRTTDSGLLH